MIGARAPAHGPVEFVSTRYELIIGSDVLYDRDSSAALTPFIERRGTPAGEVWIIDPERGKRSAFSRRLLLQSYCLTQQAIVRATGPDSAA